MPLYHPGTNILVTDNMFVSLPADDEIRGVVTTCYGDCSYNGTCYNPDVITHGVDWSEVDCVDGGILRGFRLYTNASANYENQYFGRVRMDSIPKIGDSL